MAGSCDQRVDLRTPTPNLEASSDSPSNVLPSYEQNIATVLQLATLSHSTFVP